MAAPKTRKDFLMSEEGKVIKLKLQDMTIDNQYNTPPSYNSNAVLYPDNLISFVDKHMNYLISHPTLEAGQYIANVKLITRVR